jgi:hypothetical protein
MSGHLKIVRRPKSPFWYMRGTVRHIRVEESLPLPTRWPTTPMRAIGRNEMQLDPAAGPREPFLHQLGVMVAGIVENVGQEALE